MGIVAGDTVTQYEERRYDRLSGKLALRTANRDEHDRWRAEATAKLVELIGLDTMLDAPLEPRITEEIDNGDHIRQRVEIQTEPGIIMPVYVLVPKAGRPPYPAVIAAHGHGGGGKVAVAGDRSIREVDLAIQRYNYDYGLQFARAGLIAFCPDARGMGERQHPSDNFDIMGCECMFIQGKALGLGQTITGMWTWDNMRLTDYIETRPDCRRGGVGCAGLSGGGIQTLYLSALDQRVSCAVLSGYLWGIRGSLLQYLCCSCNFIPHLWEYMDMGDIAALIAPRPLLVESGINDPLNGVGGIGNATSQVELARRAYRLLDANDMIKQDIFEEGHMWHGVEAIPWMRRHLDSDTRPPTVVRAT